MASQSARPIEKTPRSCGSPSRMAAMMANTVTSSSPCLRRPACVAPRSVLRRRALQCRHSHGTRSCAVTYRANAGSVDHPEHHAQARPKWNERYELIVRLDAIAKEKESSLPVESSTRVFGAKVHRGPNESLSRHRFRYHRTAFEA